MMYCLQAFGDTDYKPIYIFLSFVKSPWFVLQYYSVFISFFFLWFFYFFKLLKIILSPPDVITDFFCIHQLSVLLFHSSFGYHLGMVIFKKGIVLFSSLFDLEAIIWIYFENLFKFFQSHLISLVFELL